MRVAIIGFGREGKSLLRLLRKNSKQNEFWILDKNEKITAPERIGTKLGKNYLNNLDSFDIVYRSPGIPLNLPEIQKAKKAGVALSSATKLFFNEALKKTKNIVGVTGTKGKGTTTTLLYKLLKADGRKTYLVGNIGSPMLDILPKLDKNSWVILELSSFQLQDLTTSPPVAAVLHMFPDHQDSHKTLSEYYDAKTSISRYQKPHDIIFYFKKDAVSRHIASRGYGKKIAVDPSSFKLFSPSNLKVKGAHNFDNAVMAERIARSLRIPESKVIRVIKNYRGIDYRLQFVKKINSVEFYNDSASTNPNTSSAAVLSFPNQKVVLIAGGQDKNLDYKVLRDTLKKAGTSFVILIGENKDKIARAIKPKFKNYAFSPDLRSAIKLAYLKAKKMTDHDRPAVVVLSPGAASFDMFKDYKDRGNRFNKLVRLLK